MKILLLNDDFPESVQWASNCEPRGRGGAATIVADLAREYARQGHEVHVLTTHQNNPRCIREMQTSFGAFTSLPILYPAPLRHYCSLWNPRASRLIKQFLRRHGPFDAAHVHNVHSYLTYHALSILKHRNMRVVMTFHDVMSVAYGRLRTERYLDHGDPSLTALDHLRQAGRMYNIFRNTLIRAMLRHADTCVAVSNALKCVLTRNGVHVDAVIHNGIDIKSCTPSRERMEILKRKLNLGERPCIFLGGRIRPDKGIAETFAAFHVLIKSLPDALLLIVGDRKRAEVLLKEYDETRTIERNVIFTGWLPRADVLAMLALCQVCVTPSVCFDSFPTVNLEAFAVDIPVIGTCFGGTKEVVENGVSGFIIDPRDTATYVRVLTKILTNPTCAKTMGETGNRRVQAEFTLNKQAEKYLRIIVYSP